MNRLSLRTKGLIIILLISFVPLMIIGLYNYTSVKNAMVDREIENIRLKQESRSYIIDSWLETRKAEVLVMSRTNEVRSGSILSMRSYLEQEQELNSFRYSEIGFVNGAGVVTSLTGEAHMLSSEFPIARSLRGSIVLSDPINLTDEKKRLGYISVPVYSMDPTNQLIGALYAAYSFPPVTYEQALHIDEGNLYLYNYSGELLYDHLQNDFSKQEDAVIRTYLKQLAALSLTKDNDYEQVTIMNKDYIVFYHKVNNTNWVVIELEDLGKIEQLAAPVLWNMLVVVGVAICLIAIVFYAYFQNIVSRLEDIVVVTKQAAAGNFDGDHLNASVGDEIGVLANSVNGMMGRLQIMFDRLDAVINQNKSPVLVMDERYVITYMNRAAEEMLGYSSEEMTGKATPLLFMEMEEVRAKAEEFSHEIGREVQPGVELFLELRRYYSNYDFELTIISRDNKRIPVFNRSSSLRDRNGRYSGIIAILTDMSQQRQLENVNNRLQMVVESAKDLIASVDQYANIIYINEAGRKMLGLAVDYDLSQLELTSFLPEHMYKLLKRGSITARSQGFFECEAQFQNIDGKFINVSIIIVAYQDSFSGETMYSCISRDITEQLEVQRKLVHATEVAEQANKAKSNFLALMSHEIRTPLNGIIGLTQLMQKTDLDQLQAEYVQHMKDSSSMLLNIVNDVLDFSKLEAQKLEPDLAVFNIHVLINHLADQLSVFLGGKEHFEFKIYIASNVPHSMIGDALRLEQVLTNLCINAIKFTEHGLVELLIEVKSERDDEIELKFKVKDTGIGMSEEQLKGLFKPFTQADSSTTRKYGGTGLGLVISRNLIELLGGSIQVESIKRKGSMFTFTLPLKKVAYQFTLEPAKKVDEVESVVWVVEDHEVMLSYWTELLADNNYNAVKKRSWKKALLRLLRLGKGAYPAFILMDMEMNDMYGMDTWLEFQKEADSRGIPIIVITTAYGREELLMLEPGMQPDAILTKPVTKKRFQDAIDHILYQMKNSVLPSEEDVNEQHNAVQQIEPAKEVKQKLNVLLAEDNKVNQLVAAEMLRYCDCAVTITSNGLEAVERLQESHFDLVLMDIHMPVMDGLEATRTIRAQDKYHELPIVAVTANILASDHEKYLLQGMNAVLTKPLSIEQLEGVIQQYAKKIKPTASSTRKGARLSVEVNEELIMKLESMRTIHAKDAIERVNGKVNIYMHMLEQYFNDYSLFLSRIRGLYELNDYAEISRALHTLKGASSYLGAESIVKLAIEGEQIVREQQANKLQLYIDHLEEVLNITLYEISTIIDNLHT